MNISDIIASKAKRAGHQSYSVAKVLLTTLFALFALASCQDWLTIYPQTQIVEENFWEDKNDLEGVRYAAYKNMCSTLDKLVKWGEIRSDAYDWNKACENNDDRILYKNIREGMLNRDSTNAYFEWGGIYTTINYCNKVLQHGDEVQKNDKQFTAREWTQMKAEMIALRALNYFYLIRSFKDVPYTTKVINKDSEVEYFAATLQLDILDSLILDVENIRGTARNRFSKLEETKGMITNSAIYAILSDMYLWRASLHEGRWKLDSKRSTDTVLVKNIIPTSRIKNLTVKKDSIYTIHTVKGDYRLAAEYADSAMYLLNKQNEEENAKYGASKQEKTNYGLQYCYMYKNDFRNFTKGDAPKMNAYDLIFTQGNSQESIFELQFTESESRSNPVAGQLWGYSNSTRLAVSNMAVKAVYANADSERDRDSRLWFSAWNRFATESNSPEQPFCFKWQGVKVTNDENTRLAKNVSITRKSTNYSNWIIYRLSDMMLNKAEALAALKESTEAMRYVNAIHRRWYCNDDVNNPIQPSEDVTNNYGGMNDCSTANTLGNAPKATTIEMAVMNERLLEFLGEGKRWFDLVRYAERHAGGPDGTKDEREWTTEKPVNSGTAGVGLMIDTFLKTTYNDIVSSLKTRFKNRYGLYNIIHYMEIKASVDEEGMQHLYQNPVWNTKKY